MDMRDEGAWGYEHEHADEQGGYIQRHDEEPVELYGHRTYVVSLRIEF